jgi:hypothetical protein
MIFSGKTSAGWMFDITAGNMDPPTIKIYTESEYLYFLGGPPAGKQIYWREDTGEPYLADPLPPTGAELAEQARDKRDRLLADTVDKLNAPRWEGMTSEEKETWRDYRKALLDITKQPGFPVNINWPQIPG